MQSVCVKHSIYPFLDCMDGAVLLYNGTSVSPNFTAGTVLLCYNNKYGTVCDDYWDELEARVVCRQLGHEESKMLYCTFLFNKVMFETQL